MWYQLLAPWITFPKTLIYFIQILYTFLYSILVNIHNLVFTHNYGDNLSALLTLHSAHQCGQLCEEEPVSGCSSHTHSTTSTVSSCSSLEPAAPILKKEGVERGAESPSPPPPPAHPSHLLFEFLQHEQELPGHQLYGNHVHHYSP